MKSDDVDVGELIRVIGLYARRLKRGGASNETVGALLGLMNFFINGDHAIDGAIPLPAAYNGEVYDPIDT